MIRGIKLSASANACGDSGPVVLPLAREAADALGVPLMVHAGLARPPIRRNPHERRGPRRRPPHRPAHQGPARCRARAHPAPPRPALRLRPRPEDNDGNLLFRGQLGAEVTIEQGHQAARATGVQLLRGVRDALGSLDNVEYVVKALGFVNSAPGFFEQPAVMHGFSDLMTEVFGERGRADGPHHRVATCPFASTWLHRPGQPGAAQSYAGGWEARYRTTATARASRTSASAASSTSTPRVRLGRGGRGPGSSSPRPAYAPGTGIAASFP
ncbi:hypothetical protein Psuf_094250 [Phytohabitans suffuscus]|uniref:Endoribonuclease L-PSP/chorismate mutase-like domain-containing protein n=1 Tax=Phytohabitans suffuscus TaxID=624315 RepID=A0A6F8Z181_9ACTN|nr:RidA family protein [Phytohabitans suffuscus]BCB92112.1 hypothetical protein Psuf_094250 [Phytohabitans suffuscus]